MEIESVLLSVILVLITIVMMDMRVSLVPLFYQSTQCPLFTKTFPCVCGNPSSYSRMQDNLLSTNGSLSASGISCSCYSVMLAELSWVLYSLQALGSTLFEWHRHESWRCDGQLSVPFLAAFSSPFYARFFAAWWADRGRSKSDSGAARTPGQSAPQTSLTTLLTSYELTASMADYRIRVCSAGAIRCDSWNMALVHATNS